MYDHSMEIKKGERFEFGKNWRHFLDYINEDRILEAEKSLKTMLSVESLEGKSFLDIGSGSGLFSLAARRLGASVHSFDYDLQCVACTRELKNRYFLNDINWIIEEGSILNRDYINSLKKFDIVYSWGVLHHTGAMWEALGNVVPLVAGGGQLFIAIYNDQGGWSKRWIKLKKTYNLLPSFLRLPYALCIMGMRETKFILIAMFNLGLPEYVRSWTRYGDTSGRGMSRWHDMVDWIGGYPFEVAKPEEIFTFYRKRGFVLEKLKTCGGGIGCNEFVFAKRNV